MAPHHVQCQVKVLDVAPGSLAIFSRFLVPPPWTGVEALHKGRPSYLQAQQHYS